MPRVHCIMFSLIRRKDCGRGTFGGRYPSQHWLILSTLSISWRNSITSALPLQFEDTKVFWKRYITSPDQQHSTMKSATSHNEILRVNCLRITETALLLGISLVLLPMKTSSSGQTSREN